MTNFVSALSGRFPEKTPVLKFVLISARIVIFLFLKNVYSIAVKSSTTTFSASATKTQLVAKTDRSLAKENEIGRRKFFVDTFWTLVKIFKFDPESVTPDIIFDDDSAVYTMFVFAYFVLLVTIAPIFPFPIDYFILIALFSIPILTIIGVLGNLVDEHFNGNDSEPPAGSGSWVLRSFKNRLRSSEFFRAYVCDFNKFDDPFWPDHVSRIHFVEIRHHFFNLYQVVVWRVSMLNGERKQLQKFAFFRHGNRPYLYVRCYQSAGVIFIYLQYNGRRDLLYVYDMRYQRSAKYVLPREDFISMSCVDRLWNEQGFVNGWKIRFISIACIWVPNDDNVEGQERWRCRLIIKYIDLREIVQEIGQEEIDVGRFFLHAPMFNVARDSNGSFVVFAYNYRTDSPALVYQETFNVYVRCSCLEEAKRLDRLISRAINFKQVAIDDQYLFPIILTTNEAIVDDRRDHIFYSVKFGPSTLKYLATKAVFQAKPVLQNRLFLADYFYENWERILSS